MPSISSMRPKVRRGCAVMLSSPITPSTTPMQAIKQRLCHRALRQEGQDHEAEHHQAEIFGRSECDGDAREPRRHQHQCHQRKRAGDERAERGDAERRAGAALLGHLVAVDTGDDGRGLAGNVDQDRGGRAAIHRAVVDPGHHDDAGFRRSRQRDRQQQRHRRDRADAGQHADQRADEDADEAIEQVDRLERDAEAMRDIDERVHGAVSRSRRCRKATGSGAGV